MTGTLDEAREEFDRCLGAVDAHGALALVERLLAARVDPLAVMVEVVAAAQLRVGERWLRGEWSVAEEHAATSISMSALEAVNRATTPAGPTRGRAVVACAEHEWHAAPALIVAGAFRAAGWETTVLGASTSNARISRFLHDLGPDFAAVSCSVAAGLPHARGFIEASTAAGIPVLAGGAAFGTDDRRALALGATAWAADAREAVQAAAALPVAVDPVPPLPPRLAAEVSGLGQRTVLLIERLTGDWHAALGADDRHDLLEEVAAQVVRATIGAVLTSDPRLLADTGAWGVELLRERGVETDAATLLEPVAAAVPDHPLTVEAVRAAAR